VAGFSVDSVTRIANGRYFRILRGELASFDLSDIRRGPVACAPPSGLRYATASELLHLPKATTRTMAGRLGKWSMLQAASHTWLNNCCSELRLSTDAGADNLLTDLRQKTVKSVTSSVSC